MPTVQEKQQRQRARIIETTIQLMGDLPFSEISVADICEAAEISIGSFYHYFSKKSDLLIGLLGIVDSYLEAEVFPNLTNDDEIKNLDAIAKGFSKHVCENGVERSVLINGICPADNDINGEVRPVNVKLNEIFTAGQKKGQISKSYTPAQLTEWFMIILRGVIGDWTRRGAVYPLDTKCDEVMNLFFNAIRA